MKIMLLGPNGQVGWELRRSLAPLGEVLVTGRTGANLNCGDLAQVEELTRTVRQLRPDIVVNAAAYTAVDAAEGEGERELVRTVNALAPGALASEVTALGGLLVHFSTDYVFDGSGKAPWRELDPTGPLNFYGATKLEGEELIRRSRCRHLILRTSWVYAARGRNFLRSMLQAACERDSIRVVDDQIGAPTGAELVADVTSQLVPIVVRDDRLCGTYHVAAHGETTWHGWASFAIETARALGVPVKVSRGAVAPCATADYPTSARRPLNSRLATDRLEAVFGLAMPKWQAGVERAVMELRST